MSGAAPEVTLDEPSPVDDSASRSHAFIEGLFTHLLGRSRFGPEEVAYWADYLHRTKDPIDVFDRFVASEEYRDRLRKQLEVRTAFPPGHFYSPVVDVSEVAADQARIFGDRVPQGVDLKPGNQEKLFRALAPFFASLPFSDEPNGRWRYHYSNSSYGVGDACIYWSLLGLTRPSQIVEVGSGYTSALALDAIDHFGLDTRCTFVDPHPDLMMRVTEPRASRHVIVAEPVQAVGLQLVASLRANDLLFIDSSHVAKTGSDVVFEMTEMLPRLARGVIVHFHDVFHPFEYPAQWVLCDNKSWNELYFLQAFLMFNSSFEILFFNDWFAKTRRDLVIQHAGPFAERFLLNCGGGLWLRRT
jgi:hypothetical protein